MRLVHFWLVAAACGAALVIASRLLISNEYYYFAAYVVLQYIVLSTSWNILGGYTGYINFGTGAFFAIGAYSTVVLHKVGGVPLPVMMLVGGIVSGIIGLGTGYLTLRLRGIFFAIATLAITVVVQTMIINWDFVGGSRGIYIIRPANAPIGGGYIQYLYTLMIVLSVISVGIARSIERSQLGLGFAAIRDDEQAAEAGGVPTLRLKLIATTLSGVLMGMAGAPLPYYVTYVDPTSSFSLAYAVNAVAMPVIGGMQNWIGPVIGSILLGTIQQLASVTISSAVNLLIVGALLILFVIIAPNGLVDVLDGPADGPFAPPLRRLPYFVRWFAATLIICAIFYWVVPSGRAAIVTPLQNLAMTLLFFIVLVAVQLPFASQRLRDISRTGWLALLLFVPLANILLLAALFFVPSRRNSAPSLPAGGGLLGEGVAHG